MLHRRGVIRALELLAQVGGEGRQVLRERAGAGRAAGDLVTVGVPRLLGVRIGLDPLLRGTNQLLGARHELVDDPDLLALLWAHALTLKQQLQQRVDDPEHPHGADDAAGAGEQSELDLREAELDARVIDDDPVGGRRA